MTLISAPVIRWLVCGPPLNTCLSSTRYPLVVLVKILDGKTRGVLLVRDTNLAHGSLHKLQPRRIIPGQKVHASVLYANAYKPKATLGEGFDIPIIQSGVDDAELDSQIWETGLFDDTAAQELLKYLGSQQGVAPIYLDRLLFMLRFSKLSHLRRLIQQIHSLRLQRRENNASGMYLNGETSLCTSSTTVSAQRSSGLLLSLPITKLVSLLSPTCVSSRP